MRCAPVCGVAAIASYNAEHDADVEIRQVGNHRIKRFGCSDEWHVPRRHLPLVLRDLQKAAC
jgi:hypothetical protein